MPNLSLIKLLSRGLIGHGTAMEIDATLGTPTLGAVLDRFMSPSHAALAASLINSSNLSDDDTLKLARLFSRSLGVSTAYAVALEFQRVSQSGGDAYVGPLDLVPGAVVAYSAARALSAAWIGGNVVELRRDSDDATSIRVAAADGSVDVAAAIAWRDAAGAANAFIRTTYDQSGNGNNLTLVTAANQNLWTPNAVGGHPAMTNGPDGDNYVSVSSVVLPSGAFTSFAVSKGINEAHHNGASDFAFSNKLGSIADVDIRNVSNGNEAGGDFTNETDDGAYHAWDAACAVGSHSFRCDGAALTQQVDYDAGGAIGSATIAILGLAVIQSNVGFAEYILYDGVKSDPNRTLVRANQKAYYATP